MNKNIYVIIVTWNGMKWIKRCLDALRESTYPVNVVVIDNGSTDETVPFIKGNYPEVHLIESKKNLGFGQANNEGMRYALSKDCDYVYLLNQDAYVYPDMFEKLIRVAEKNENENYAIFSPLHIHGDEISFDKQFRDYITDISPILFQDLLLKQLNSIYPVLSVPAAGWLLPNKTLNTIGGFDPIFFHYGEDDHYCQRVKFHGFSIGIVPTAKMIHDRENFGNEKIAKKDVIYRGQKSYVFLNVNLTSLQRFTKFLKTYLIFFLYGFKYLFQGNFSRVLEIYSSLLKIIWNMNAFRKNRLINRTKGPNWL